MATLIFDSNSELIWSKAQELNLNDYIKMPYTICNNEYFYDLGEHYDPKWFFNLIRQGNVPITSALNPENYKEFFEPYFKRGEEILYISFSSKMSGTFTYLDTAIKELKMLYPDVKYTRYDSKAISMATGLQVYAAGKAFNEGSSIDDIIELLDDISPRANIIMLADDLQYLKRGGRLNAIQTLVGGILKIKPVIKLLDDGTLAAKDKVSGLNKAINLLAQDTIEHVQDIDEYPIVVLDADNVLEGDRLFFMIREKLPNAEVWRQSVGPVIGTHCGPGTIAVCYIGSDRPKA
ncbi:MAG: DegV family protein [Christensenellaceae bacterium]|jgi:DegV family protein with EDD domain|nr:DegV family protein [Christensenellaceae bacterium]